MLLAAITAILATWAIAGAVLIGIGLLLGRAVGGEATGRGQFAECFWGGFGLLLLFVQGWHFFLPVDGRCAGVLAGVGGAGWLIGWRPARRWLWDAVVHRRWAAAVSALACVWLADRCVGPPGAFDSGVYHIPAVEWFTAHPVVPGLGNLHGRLAFNNSSLLYTAVLDVGVWRHRSEHLANGLLLAGLMTQVVFACARLLRGTVWSAGDVLLCVLLVPCLYLATDPTNLNIASPTTDGAAIIVTFVSAAWAVSLLGGKSPRAPGTMFRAVVTALLMAAAVTIKLSTIGYAAVGWIVLAAWWARGRQRVEERAAVRAGGWAVVLAAALAGTWAVRGIVLSGYPAFPAGAGAMDVDWRVPEDRARYHERVITLFGRYDGAPGHEERGLDEPWLRGWARSALWYKFELVLPAALCVGGLLLIAGVWAARGSTTAGGEARAWWLGVALAAGLSLWFVKAPQPRLALHLAWSLAGLCAAMGAVEVRAWAGTRRTGAVVVGVVCALSAGMLGVRTLKQTGREDGDPLRTLVVGSGSDYGLHPAPAPVLVRRTTRWGLEVSCSATDGRVWHAPLLTTCEFDDRLRLRTPGNVRAGFRCSE